MNGKNLAPIKGRVLQIANIKQITKKELFERLGVSASNFRGNGVYSEINADTIAKISTIFPDINLLWILTGKGSVYAQNSDTFAIKSTETIDQGQKAVPLVESTAIAGFGNSNFFLDKEDIKDLYIIPKFKFLQVDFMIEVTGTSMTPAYNSGDVIACTIIKNSSFIQWNRAHLICTRSQGLMVKRITQSPRENHYTLVSENPEYPPFDIPIDEITGIALIVGIVRVE